MARIESFPPIGGASAQKLILGTMPGIASLTAHQYYAHPRNAFWAILGGLIGFDPRLPYADRAQRLIDAGIAVWDVLQSCERPGSLDSRIEPSSISANDFERFFSRHPRIESVYFNGAAADTLYRRHVLPTLAPTTQRTYVRLPSTSPANASVPLTAKADAWRVVTRTSVLHNRVRAGVR